MSGSTLGVLQSALSAAHLQQKVYAQNIANAQTPGYRAKDVVFQNMLYQAVAPAPVPVLTPGQTAVPLPIGTATQSGVQPVVVSTGGSTVSNNGNNVNIESQMVGLATNQLRYNAISQDISMRFARIKQVLTEV